MLIRSLAITIVLALFIVACGDTTDPSPSLDHVVASPEATAAPTTTVPVVLNDEEPAATGCAVLPGSRFESIDQHEIGKRGDGTLVMGLWTLDFTAARVVWNYSDTRQTFDYRCEDGVITTDLRADISGDLMLDGEELWLEWDGRAYAAATLGDAAAYGLPDPDTVAAGSADDALLFGIEVIRTLLAGDANGWRDLTADTLYDLDKGGIVDAASVDAMLARQPFPHGYNLSGFTIDDYLWQHEPKVFTFGEVAEVFEGFDVEALLLEAGWEPTESAFVFAGNWPRSDAPGLPESFLMFFVAAFDGEAWEIATLTID